MRYIVLIGSVIDAANDLLTVVLLFSTQCFLHDGQWEAPHNGVLWSYIVVDKEESYEFFL